MKKNELVLLQQCNDMGASHRRNFEVEKPDRKQYILCAPIYMKFKNTDKAIHGVGDQEHGNPGKA